MTKQSFIKPEFVVQDEAALRALFPATHAAAIAKSLDHIDRHAADFIARAPFLCIGTQSAEGRADVSPRGDPCGFVKVLDAMTLLIPDRPGNNRLDTQSNILANPTVGLLFMIPGFDDTLRVNGTAQISTDPELLALAAMNGRLSTTVIILSVTEVFLHCAKAFRRSSLWDPAARQDRRQMPSLMAIILDQTTGAPKEAKALEALDADLERAYKASMF